jgi:predicted outer membrane repeat protein
MLTACCCCFAAAVSLFGGAIWGLDVSVQDTTFTGNSAGSDGGAVFVFEGGQLFLAGSTFKANTGNSRDHSAAQNDWVAAAPASIALVHAMRDARNAPLWVSVVRTTTDILSHAPLVLSLQLASAGAPSKAIQTLT